MLLAKQNNLDVALQMALDALNRADLSPCCENAGASYEPASRAIKLKYLDRLCVIQLPEGRFCWGPKPGAPPLAERILILHYLNRASGTPLSGKLVSFGEVPGGREYLPAFRRRSVDMLLGAFAHRPEALLDTAALFGGIQAGYGDISATIYALPQVPLTFVLWRGDDELHTSGNILFDSTVSEYLPTEDIAVLAGVVSARLRKGLADPANVL